MNKRNRTDRLNTLLTKSHRRMLEAQYHFDDEHKNLKASRQRRISVWHLHISLLGAFEREQTRSFSVDFYSKVG